MSEDYDYSGGFRARTRVSLARPGLRNAVAHATDRQNQLLAESLDSLKDAEALKDLGGAIRASVLSRLDEHLDRLAQSWEKAGGRVFFAADADEANDYVREIASRVGARTAVKSKSMASEEIGLNHALESIGVQPIETDLGEYIIQMAGEHPSHLIAPAVHKQRSDVRELFSKIAGEELPDDASELVRFARLRLREKFLAAELGISGVNFAVADPGVVCIVTNEGNARMCTSMPRTHVAIMGMERVVANWEQLAVMLSLLGRHGTGQKLTQYTSLLCGPRRADESDGPEESHLVILDNGRSKLLGTRYQDALRCIRCGACLNVCPVFRQVGGHAYDAVYSGPIGAVLNPLIKGPQEAGELAHASTLCGACTDVCPVRIPLHDLLLYLRQDYAREAAPRVERVAYRAWSEAWAGERRFRWFGHAGEVLGRVTRSRPLKRLPLPLLSRWTKGRTFPGFPRSTFRDRRRGD
ncbi:MAG: LutB/LldF family L-lactate oxidation iron-sulfur protein [Candidatus Rokuibacteriota bacterium]